MKVNIIKINGLFYEMIFFVNCELDFYSFFEYKYLNNGFIVDSNFIFILICRNEYSSILSICMFLNNFKYLKWKLLI